MTKNTEKIVPVIELTVGADIGNSSTEIAIQNENGVYEYFTQSSVIHSKPLRPEEEIIDSISKSLDELLDNLDVFFGSEKLNLNRYYSVGTQAIKSNASIRNMDITLSDKANNDIPMITSISMLAAIALKKHYAETNELPNDLEAKINMCTAIPASEYTVAKARMLEDRFKASHTVKLYIGSEVITVNVNIINCRVTEEGKTAMLAFSAANDDIFDIYKETYENKDSEFYDESSNITLDQFLESESFHSDIGDGSTEFTFIDGFNPVNSHGVMAGVGHVTANAIEEYKARLNNSVVDVPRQYFMQLLRSNKSKSALAKEVFDSSLNEASTDMYTKMTNQYMSLTKSAAEFLVVHGGGANVFKDKIYSKYVEFANRAMAKVLWVPEKYATKMNSTGLLVLAQNIYENK
ncbi:hypothetical protein MKX73_19170 [Solibacillus sp. FSL W7-1436]|uniref:ParM/StbA family protein n=1 Tax=Solibacillus sp. FSL W7-1436 TaxID=2921705 RepID=UPI0030FCBCE6